MVVTALLMPVFLGLAALVMDLGLMMTVHGQVRSLADATAQMAALRMLQGGTHDDARLAASEFAALHSSLNPAPTITVHIPPQSGDFAGDEHYVEVKVEETLETFFVQFLGSTSTQNVTARSVAGIEPVSQGARIVLLDQTALPGLHLFGAGQVRVSGGVIVNSAGGGLTEQGLPIENGASKTAISVGGSALLTADDVQVVGGVNDPTKILPLLPHLRSPLRTGSRPLPDPYASLPPPTVSTGANSTLRGSATISQGNANVSGGNQVLPSGDVVLKPGVYDFIQISGGRVKLEAGIYILRGGKQDSLSITGGEVDGTAGVMFYNTGHDFQADTGWPDSTDEANGLANLTGSKFGGFRFNASAQLAPLNHPGTLFHGLLFYQRRANLQTIQIAGQSNQGDLQGILYAKNAELQISGQGTYNAQMVVGRLQKTGNGDIVIQTTAAAPATARKVFLVE